MIIENSKSKHRNFSMAWIDLCKASDSVPHSWVLTLLDLFKILPSLINFLRIKASMWKQLSIFQSFNLTHQNGNFKSEHKSKSIKINSDIFQGDPLSPLYFCLPLTPLSKELKLTGYGYDIRKSSVNHLFYMDDLSPIPKDDNDLEGLLQTVKKFTDDIGMSFGLDKCTKATFKRAKLTGTISAGLDRD